MAERFVAVLAESHDMRPRIKMSEACIYDTQTEAAPGDDVVIDLASGGFILREFIGTEDKGYRLKSYSPAAVSVIPFTNVAAMYPIIARCRLSFYDEIQARRKAATCEPF